MRPPAILSLVALALPVIGMRMAGAPGWRIAVRSVHARGRSLPRLAACLFLARLAIALVPGRPAAAAMWLFALRVARAGLRVRMRVTMAGLAAARFAITRLAVAGLGMMGLAAVGLAIPVLPVARLPVADLTILALVAAGLPRFAASLVAVVPTAAMAAFAARFRVAMMAVGRPSAACRAITLSGMALA